MKNERKRRDRSPHIRAVPDTRRRHRIPEDRRSPAIISEFQPDAVEIAERSPPRLARLTLYWVTAMIAAAILWATVSQVDEIVVAEGKLITTAPTIVVQPLETSIVRAIDVSVGDIVKAGDPLATLDPTFTQADFDQMQSRFGALDAQVARLEAELAGEDYRVAEDGDRDQALQAQLFNQRNAYREAQLRDFDEQIAGEAAALIAAKSEADILSKRLEGLNEIEQIRQTLRDRQTGSLFNLLVSRDARLDVEAQLSQVRGRIDTAKHGEARIVAGREAFLEDLQRTTMEELVSARNERDAARDELKKMRLRRDFATLVAPADAVVLDLAQRSIGSIVREAEPVVTLVPLDVPLEAEVEIKARDIGRISSGEPVRIKFEAYPFQKYGTTPGTVRTVSQDAFAADETARPESAPQPFFRARVALDGGGPDKNGEPVQLLPGMTVTAEIDVGSRSVISYFLYPLLRGLDNSIREP